MYLRSGRLINPRNMSSENVDRKQVLVDGKIPGRRIISLRTYFKESEEERRITLINLFKKEDKGAVDQLVSVLMELTLTTDPK